MHLSNIKALNGLSAVSLGGGIRSTIALRISVIPIPSYKREGMPILLLSMRYRLMPNVRYKDKINEKLTLAEQNMALLQSNPTTYIKKV
jgi:hypothetical protein